MISLQFTMEDIREKGASGLPLLDTLHSRLDRRSTNGPSVSPHGPECNLSLRSKILPEIIITQDNAPRNEVSFGDSLRRYAVTNHVALRSGSSNDKASQEHIASTDLTMTEVGDESTEAEGDPMYWAEGTNRDTRSAAEYDTFSDDDTTGPCHTSSSDVYISACRRLRVVPTRQVKELLSEHILPLNHLNIADHGLSALSLAIVHNRTVTTLQLSDNALSKRGLQDLCIALTRNNVITTLDLSENKLGLSGAKLLAGLLVINKTLSALNASGNNFRDAGVRYIARALKKNRGLRTLELSHNHLEDEGGILLGRALGENDFLQNLNLRWNHLRHKGAQTIIRSLKDNATLRTLNLAWNGLSDPGASTMGQYLGDNETLQEVDLTSNRIHLEGATVLAKGLRRNSTLNVLKLSKNPIASKGACLILEAIKSNEESQVSSFEIMDVEINAHFEALLEEVQSRRPLAVTHGGLVTDDPYGQPARPLPATIGDPVSLLFTYAKTAGLRLIDLFAQLDMDNSSSVSHGEFKMGLKRSGLPLSDLQVEKLITVLDANGDGEIDFRELMEGQRIFRDRERRRQRAISPHTLPVDRTTTPGSERHLQGLGEIHVPPPRVASPRLAMDSPLGRSTLIYTRQDSHRRESTYLPPTFEDEDINL